jgi:hypothetical protein
LRDFHAVIDYLDRQACSAPDVEVPTTGLELTVNREAAAVLGLTVPASLRPSAGISGRPSPGLLP